MSSGDLNVKCIIYIAHVHNMKKHATERWSIISMTVNLPNSSSPPALLHTSVFWAQWHSSCLFPGLYSTQKWIASCICILRYMWQLLFSSIIRHMIRCMRQKMLNIMSKLLSPPQTWKRVLRIDFTPILHIKGNPWQCLSFQPYKGVNTSIHLQSMSVFSFTAKSTASAETLRYIRRFIDTLNMDSFNILQQNMQLCTLVVYKQITWILT